MNGADFLAEVPKVALTMSTTMDKRWKLTPLTELWLAVQLELDSHNDPYRTWWVRWVSNDATPIESHYCPHVLNVVVAVAAILDKAGISVNERPH
jgi:hypothetical protein